MLLQIFLGSLSFYHLTVPKPGGCSFYCMYLLWLFMFLEKKMAQTSEPANRLTGTAVVVSHFQTSQQDRIIRLKMTEVIVPYHQSLFDLSIFF